MSPLRPPVHNYAFTLNGVKMDTALTFEQALGLAQVSKYHRRDKRAHLETDIYAVTSFPGLMIVQVLAISKVVYALMHECHRHNNDNNLWTKEQILATVKRVQGFDGHADNALAQYRCAILTSYANNQ